MSYKRKSPLTAGTVKGQKKIYLISSITQENHK